MTELNLQTALTIVQDNSQEFKVDFNELWKWCGYSRKDSAKRTLESNFEERFDFHIIVEATTTGISATHKQNIYLTLDAAKEFAMLAQTSQGKTVRKYFIQAEKQLRQPKTRLELAKEQVRMIEAIELLEEEKRLLEEDNERQSEVIDELFNYSSIVRVSKLNGCHEKSFSWRTLKAASNLLELEVKKAPCPRYGTKNLYSHSAWSYAYPDYQLPESVALVNK